MKLGYEITMDEIYQEIQEFCNLSDEETQKIKKLAKNRRKEFFIQEIM